MCFQSYRASRLYFFLLISGLVSLGMVGAGRAAQTLDLLTPPEEGSYTRVLGALGAGRFGVPVCGGHDCDGDGFPDMAFASMSADPLSRGTPGMVTMVWGNGTLGETVNSNNVSDRILYIFGDQVIETTGSEIWMDDVNGDGLGDLLIGRQNYSPSLERRGAGALTIILGSPELRAINRNQAALDLRNPSAKVSLINIFGAKAYDRLGIWMRTGDVDGDGIADIAVGADEADGPNQRNRGEVYLIKGGGHLSESRTIDLAEFPSNDLGAPVVRIVPPPIAAEFHFGATVQLGDIDGNGMAELLVGATLDRAGAGLRLPNAPLGTGISAGGALGGGAYILWDRHFSTENWVSSYELALEGVEPDTTIISGGIGNVRFGEEFAIVPDLDGDGRIDLVIGDLQANTSNGLVSGISYVFSDAVKLRGRSFNMSNPPASLAITRIPGPAPGALSGDTIGTADLDGDGNWDLVMGNPHDSPNGRVSAGSLVVLYGQRNAWPEAVNLAPSKLPAPGELRWARVLGGRGSGTDVGDTLGYSMALADLDGDQWIDIITNEMVGNGSAARDVGNLVAISGRALLRPEVAEPVSISQSSFFTDGGAVFSFTSRLGERYTLEASTDLLRWDAAADPADGVRGILSLESVGSGQTQRYFRIRSAIP